MYLNVLLSTFKNLLEIISESLEIMVKFQCESHGMTDISFSKLFHKKVHFSTILFCRFIGV